MGTGEGSARQPGKVDDVRLAHMSAQETTITEQVHHGQ